MDSDSDNFTRAASTFPPVGSHSPILNSTLQKEIIYCLFCRELLILVIFSVNCWIYCQHNLVEQKIGIHAVDGGGDIHTFSAVDLQRSILINALTQWRIIAGYVCAAYKTVWMALIIVWFKTKISNLNHFAWKLSRGPASHKWGGRVKENSEYLMKIRSV